MNNKLNFTVAYYPEVWEDKEISEDIKQMKKIGITCVRIGEFEWSSLEPSENQFDFSRISYAIDRLAKEGIDVVLCTPSATLPKWLIDKYPNSMKTLSNGKKMEFGSRAHSCKSNEELRERIKIIIEKMCKELANKPNVIGFQVDNEIYPYDDGCFCPSCVNKFRKYLQKKYGTIQNLNKEWKRGRWSLTFNDFDDVLPPMPNFWNDPSVVYEWKLFQSDLNIDFIHFQNGIIKKYTDKVVGTDMMTMTGVNHRKMNDALDIVQINHYEMVNTYHSTLFWLDYVRSLKSIPFWVTETAPSWYGGHTADGGYKPSKMVYNNMFLSFIKGANNHAFWLWRAHPCGQELMHSSLIDASRRYLPTTPVIKNAISKINHLKDFFATHKIKSKIALLYSFNSCAQLGAVPCTKDFDYLKELQMIYRGLISYSLDVIDENCQINDYEVLITPFISHIDGTLKNKILDWVKKGGKWIVGPLSDIFDNSLKKYTSTPFSFLEEVGGVYKKYTIPVDAPFEAKYQNGKALNIRSYYDGFELNGAASIADYSNGDLDGLSTITVNHYGDGRIVLIGSFVDAKDYAFLIDNDPLLEVSDNISLDSFENDDSIISALEIDGKNGYIILNDEYTNLLDEKVYFGKVEIQPYDVFIFQKK